MITCFSPPPEQHEIPLAFPSPFNARPHPLARRAAVQLQEYLRRQSDWQHDFTSADGGKMFGVLVVRDARGQPGFISAYSGMLAGQWLLPDFVPPIFDMAQRAIFLPAGESVVEAYTHQIQQLQDSDEYRALQGQLQILTAQRDVALADLKTVHSRRKRNRHEQRLLTPGVVVADDSSAQAQAQLLVRLSFESQQDRREQRALSAHWAERLLPVYNRLGEIDQQIEALKKKRTQQSRQLHKQVFKSYTLINSLGEQKVIADCFSTGHPPGGAGDCAAPKLIHYALCHGLTPVAMAEFWWGAPPIKGVRHHGNYYPACRGKCYPILPFMFKGINMQAAPRPGSNFSDDKALDIVYEDTDLLVVNKPSGLLSVPGKEIHDSVLTRLQQHYPEAMGPLLVHRIDMATSGLLLAAKTRAAHKSLQKQFIKRTIEKRYLAVLSTPLQRTSSEQSAFHQASGLISNSGTIQLPLRVDLDDRPRQLVCHEHGKAAITRWEVISRDQDRTRVYFYPLTGRTHQLRVHASHHCGLNAPIIGDELYGEQAERLLLHAERLCFKQPTTGQRLEIIVPAPF
jgi:tRNA pseudouridine32 synthase/23S rRNA pseudouridine746 synthase